MGVRVLESADGRMAAMYSSSTDWAFGPVHYGDNAAEELRAFLKWLACDPRLVPDNELERKYWDWRQAVDEAAERAGK